MHNLRRRRVPSIPAASFPLPPRLEGLRRLAYNLHWAWHPRTRALFNLIDRTAWNRYRNPIPVISGPTEWPRLLDDARFLAEYHDVLDHKRESTFAVELVLVSDPGGANATPFTFSYHARHNSAT